MNEMSDNKMNGKDFMLGALVGGLIGAMAALLLAPKTGKEIRGDISDKYRDVSHKAQETAKQVAATTTEFADKVKELAVNVKDDLQSWRGTRKQNFVSAEEEVAVDTQHPVTETDPDENPKP
jgi:gas vesicle protein